VAAAGGSADIPRALPHAVSSISGGAISTPFTYDRNGNRAVGLGHSMGSQRYGPESHRHACADRNSNSGSPGLSAGVGAIKSVFGS
jgi:hypothetical protein